jgi:hypothetical protein
MERKKSAVSREDLRDQLSINKDDLDTSLVEQPDLYYHVAECYSESVAERDASKLDLEQAIAGLDEQLRQEAAAREEKVTETLIQRRLATHPRIQELERNALRLRAEVDKWQALKEAYQQRSFMLRELVQMLIARLSNTSLERGVISSRGSYRDAVAQSNHEAASKIRRDRRHTDAHDAS